MDGNGKGLQSVAEGSAEEGAKLCLAKLKGKDRKAVVAFLGKPHQHHEQEEYLYYPERSDGSMWVLLILFDEKSHVCSIFGDEANPIEETQPKDCADAPPQ